VSFWVKSGRKFRKFGQFSKNRTGNSGEIPKNCNFDKKRRFFIKKVSDSSAEKSQFQFKNKVFTRKKSDSNSEKKIAILIQNCDFHDTDTFHGF